MHKWVLESYCYEKWRVCLRFSVSYFPSKYGRKCYERWSHNNKKLLLHFTVIVRNNYNWQELFFLLSRQKISYSHFVVDLQIDDVYNLSLYVVHITTQHILEIVYLFFVFIRLIKEESDYTIDTHTHVSIIYSDQEIDKTISKLLFLDHKP